MIDIDKQPLVSIIIPTYKDRGHLKRAIDSVIRQTYSNLEIIVVDDNDPGDEWRNKTENLISTITDHRLKYIKHSKNKNGAAARNTGILNSSGDYIAFLDDDDWFFPRKIEKQIDYMRNNLQYDASYSQGEKNGHIIANNLKEGNLMCDILMLRSYMYTPSLMFRKTSLQSLNGFDENFKRHQDYELLLRFFKLGFKIGAIQECLFAIGNNDGENMLSARRYEELKHYFFGKFGPYIHDIDKTETNFKYKVYAIHYSGVFLSYLKERSYKDAVRIFNKYFWHSPAAFAKVLTNSIYHHLF